VILHLHTPRPPLDRFVEVVTFFAEYQPEHSRERLLPDGRVEIIIDLTDERKRLYNRDDTTESRSFRHHWISGMRREWIVIDSGMDSSMAVIRFKPGGAYPFLGFALEGITDTVDQLETILGRDNASLRDRILAAPTIDHKMAAIEAWLLERAAGRLEANPVIEYMAGRLFAPAGIRVADVVQEIGYSQRHLLGLFRRWVGITPKQYGRIGRFQRMLSSVARDCQAVDLQARSLPCTPISTEPDWADVAIGHGYYDQSHLVRDFRDFSGMTPSAYLASFRGLENYLPYD
jgi:AraC-like DNA-binding protein